MLRLAIGSSRLIRPSLTPRYCCKLRHTASIRTMATKPLAFEDGPLVWIDCEMTGLDIEKDRLLEIAVVITNGNLEKVDNGIQFVIRTEKQVLDNMNEWCVKQHGQSGLTQACLKSTFKRDYVAGQVLQYIKRWIPKQRAGVLAGNSVHADRVFLVKEMPNVVDWLHYRIVDVSSIKELARRWYPQQKEFFKYPSGSDHRALTDINNSIKELQWYRRNLFVSPSDLKPEAQRTGTAD